MLTWDSNPFAYGAIHARMEGRKSSVGGISNTDSVHGYLFGMIEQEAMDAVQEAFNQLPLGVIRALKDELPYLR